MEQEPEQATKNQKKRKNTNRRGSQGARRRVRRRRKRGERDSRHPEREEGDASAPEGLEHVFGHHGAVLPAVPIPLQRLHAVRADEPHRCSAGSRRSVGGSKVEPNGAGGGGREASGTESGGGGTGERRRRRDREETQGGERILMPRVVVYSSRNKRPCECGRRVFFRARYPHRLYKLIKFIKNLKNYTYFFYFILSVYKILILNLL
jgi:hypothetical protein